MSCTKPIVYLLWRLSCPQPCIRRLFAGFLPCRPESSSGPFHAGWVLNTEILVQLFLTVLQFTLPLSFLQDSTLINLSIPYAIVSRTHWPHLPPRSTKYSCCWVDPRAVVRAEGLGQWKIQMMLSGIEPATSLLLAQCLNPASPTDVT